MFIRIKLNVSKTGFYHNGFYTRFFKLKFNESYTAGAKHIFNMYGFFYQHDKFKPKIYKNNECQQRIVYRIL